MLLPQRMDGHLKRKEKQNIGLNPSNTDILGSRVNINSHKNIEKPQLSSQVAGVNLPIINLKLY